MKISSSAAAVVCILASAVSAAAQPASAGAETKRFATISTGVAIAAEAGAVVRLEAGQRVWRNLDIVVEGAWFQNTVNHDQLDRAKLIADGIAANAGGETSSSVEAPALFGGIGVRWTLEGTTLRPYAQVTFGGVRGERNPSFSLNGTDITGSLEDYGVTLGDDINGDFGAGAVSTGGGLEYVFKGVRIDGGLRLLSYPASGSWTNAVSVTAGVTFRF